MYFQLGGEFHSSTLLCEMRTTYILSKTFRICSRKKLVVIFFLVRSSCFDIASFPASHVIGKSRSFFYSYKGFL